MQKNQRVAIVTGANAGLGYESALRMAEKGLHVVLVCRNMEKAVRSADNIEHTLGNQVTLTPLAADLSVQSEIHQLAEEIKNQFDRIDVLLNNAGAVFSNFQRSVDGIEMTMAVNHFSYFLLTNLLLPLMQGGDEARIVNVSSNSHFMGRFDPAYFTSAKGYSLLNAYAHSKLANMLFTRALDKRLRGSNVTANAVSPGRVKTEIASKNQPLRYRVAWKFLNLIGGRNVMDGASMQVSAAVDTQWAGMSGYYLENMRVRKASALAQDDQLAERLWAISEQLCPI